MCDYQNQYNQNGDGDDYYNIDYYDQYNNNDQYNDNDNEDYEDGDDYVVAYTNSETCLPGDKAKVVIDCTYEYLFVCESIISILTRPFSFYLC